LPDVATAARPVIAVAARLVVGAATEIVPSDAIAVLAPCFTPPRTEAVATGSVYDDPPEPPETVTAPVWPFTEVTTLVARSLIWLAVWVWLELA
jgi:hypothetical protein